MTLPGGRPNGPATLPHVSQFIASKFPEDLAVALRANARAQDRSVSAVVRLAVRQYLAAQR